MSDRMWGGDEKSSPSFFPRDDQYFSLFVIFISLVSLVVRPGYFFVLQICSVNLYLYNKKRYGRKTISVQSR